MEVAEDKEVAPQAVIVYGFPNYIKKKAGKFFAVVFPGVQSNEKSKREIVTLLSGCIERTDLMISEVERDDGKAHLSPWERMPIMNFSDFVTNYRRAILLQG